MLRGFLSCHSNEPTGTTNARFGSLWLGVDNHVFISVTLYPIGSKLVRLKCKKCQNVFDLQLSAGSVLGSIHVGPSHLMKCPACGARSMFNIYSSVKEPVTWPKKEEPSTAKLDLTDAEREEKAIEESKYETD